MNKCVQIHACIYMWVSVPARVLLIFQVFPFFRGFVVTVCFSSSLPLDVCLTVPVVARLFLRASVIANWPKSSRYLPYIWQMMRERVEVVTVCSSSLLFFLSLCFFLFLSFSFSHSLSFSPFRIFAIVTLDTFCTYQSSLVTKRTTPPFHAFFFFYVSFKWLVTLAWK